MSSLFAPTFIIVCEDAQKASTVPPPSFFCQQQKHLFDNQELLLWRRASLRKLRKAAAISGDSSGGFPSAALKIEHRLGRPLALWKTRPAAALKWALKGCVRQTSGTETVPQRSCERKTLLNFRGKFLGAISLGSVPTTPDPNTSAKVSIYKWEA